MAIEFNCPHCGAFYRLDEKFAGKMGKCKSAKCQQSILIPFRSTASTAQPVPPQKIDAETLAAAAFSEEPAAKKEAAAAPSKQIAVTCHFCEHKFEVDSSMAGKNMTCPECSKIIRVPKIIEDKPSDWRTSAGGRPSMAKAAETVPTGAWDGERKGVSVQALQKAGAIEVEDEEEPRERRLRRIKQALYGSALLGIVVFAVVFFLRMKRDRKEEGWMEKAVAEIENPNDGSKRSDFRAAIHAYAGEYQVRAAQKPESLEAAVKLFDKARDELQRLPENDPDRNAMLGELGAMLVICGGTAAEISEDRRLPWDKVHPLIRRCLDKIPADQSELRARSIRLLTRKLNEKGQGLLSAKIARTCCVDEADQPGAIGRVGIELFLLDQKGLAEQVLEQAGEKPAAGEQQAPTILWLALHPDADAPPADFPGIAPPDLANPRGISRLSRLAYAEGRALQGRLKEARKMAELAGAESDRIEALLNVAGVALGKNQAADAGEILDEVAAIVKAAAQPQSVDPWLLVRGVELATRANKTEAGQILLDAIKDESIKSWARLEVLRVKLAGQRQKKADDKWLEAIPDPADARLAPALAQAEFARHNTNAGEKFDADSLPKGTIRPFGYAGIALGRQDAR